VDTGRVAEKSADLCHDEAKKYQKFLFLKIFARRVTLCIRSELRFYTSLPNVSFGPYSIALNDNVGQQNKKVCLSGFPDVKMFRGIPETPP